MANGTGVHVASSYLPIIKSNIAIIALYIIAVSMLLYNFTVHTLLHIIDKHMQSRDQSRPHDAFSICLVVNDSFDFCTHELKLNHELDK